MLLHDLRHTWAWLCASAGVHSAQVAAWMGHASDVITRTTYTHLFAEDTAAAVAALEAVSGRPAGPGGGVPRPRLALAPTDSASDEGARRVG